MVMNKTDLEPLGCGWCSYSDGTGFSISKADNLAGGCVNKGSDGDVCTFFANTCPSFANDIPFVQQEFFTDEVVVVILSVLIYSGFAVLYVKLLDRHCRKLRSHRSYGPFKKEIIRRLQIELSELNSDAETENRMNTFTISYLRS
uniref:Uncharacterized protein n=1 Tax=Plectus sambesii TaxID=2011161 RepID=A0A914X514_9BILA